MDHSIRFPTRCISAGNEHQTRFPWGGFLNCILRSSGRCLSTVLACDTRARRGRSSNDLTAENRKKGFKERLESTEESLFHLPQERRFCLKPSVSWKVVIEPNLCGDCTPCFCQPAAQWDTQDHKEAPDTYWSCVCAICRNLVYGQKVRNQHEVYRL